MSESVEKLLRDSNIPFTSSGRDYLIKCLNPDHEDSNPSLRIDKISGLAHCFSCGWKRNLFKHYNVNPPITSIKIAKLKEKIQVLKIDPDLEMLEGAIRFKEAFRGISLQTLRYFEAFTTSAEEKLQDRLIFPIRDIRGKIKVFVCRHMYSDVQPKYLYHPGNTKMETYPVKIDSTQPYIIIVEGIFDMLNLHDKGVKNVVAVFGTQSLKDRLKEKLLIYKLQGVQKVYIAFDGDEPGRKAAAELQPLIEAEEFKVEIIELADDTDPGTMTQEEADTIRKYVE